MLYIPSIAILSQYFRKRRALAMTIVASGSSLGAVIHPLMLNNTLNKPSIGFAIAARANAGLVSGLLLIACLLMRTRVEPPKNHIDLRKAVRRFVKDRPYVFAFCGWVPSGCPSGSRICSTNAPFAASMSTFVAGFYFPLFYLQLDALTHGLNKTFSFNAVCSHSSLL